MNIVKPAYTYFHTKIHPGKHLGRSPLAKQWSKLSDETLNPPLKSTAFRRHFLRLSEKAQKEPLSLKVIVINAPRIYVVV